MRRLIRAFLFTLLVLTLTLPILYDGVIHATSWAYTTPQEVIKRSTLIVEGTYNFKRYRDGSGSIWGGYDFRVERVYKGIAHLTMTVGIDGYDVGWADKHQREGGGFLLFLNEGQDSSIPVPVNGPNGMIRLMDGEFVGLDEYDSGIFTEYLSAIEPREPLPDEDDGKADPSVLVILLFGILYSLSILNMMYRKLRSPRR